jgi:hypothetical protein
MILMLFSPSLPPLPPALARLGVCQVASSSSLIGSVSSSSSVFGRRYVIQVDVDSPGARFLTLSKISNSRECLFSPPPCRRRRRGRSRGAPHPPLRLVSPRRVCLTRRRRVAEVVVLGTATRFRRRRMRRAIDAPLPQLSFSRRPFWSGGQAVLQCVAVQVAFERAKFVTGFSRWVTGQAQGLQPGAFKLWGNGVQLVQPHR